MKTKLLILMLAFAASAAAQQKVSERTALSAGNLAPATDILPIVDISAGTAGSKKIIVNDLFTGWGFTAAGAALAKAADDPAQRALLGFTGNIYSLSYGTSVGNLVRLDPTTGKLPAVDGSLLTNLPAPGTTLTDSASLRTALSDETGTGVAVFGTSPTIGSPALTTPTIAVGSDATGDMYYRSAGGVFTRLGVGTNGHVLTLAAGLPSWAAAAGGGGLTNWTDAVSTSSPNATVPASSLTATNAASNVDAVIKPKGTGALLAQIPDNSTTGGNKRGANAVDLSTVRGTNSEVASGANSTIAGGQSNTASGSDSVVSGGVANLADGTRSVIVGGAFATARGLYGNRAHAVETFFNLGDAQSGSYKLMRETSDDTITEITLGNQSSGATTRVVLSDYYSYSFKGQAIARAVDGTSKSWQFSGCIKRGANAAATALVGSVTSATAADAGASAWALTIDADTTNGSLRFQGTGAAATDIRWLVQVDTLELQLN